MPRRPVRPADEASPLRRARLARNWTLEDVVEEIDLRSPGGHSGVTPSMVSGWELGRHTTSIGHRKMLIQNRDPKIYLLFGHNQRRSNHKVRNPRLNGDPVRQNPCCDLIHQKRLS